MLQIVAVETQQVLEHDSLLLSLLAICDALALTGFVQERSRCDAARKFRGSEPANLDRSSSQQANVLPNNFIPRYAIQLTHLIVRVMSFAGPPCHSLGTSARPLESCRTCLEPGLTNSTPMVQTLGPRTRPASSGYRDGDLGPRDYRSHLILPPFQCSLYPRTESPVPAKASVRCNRSC